MSTRCNTNWTRNYRYMTKIERGPCGWYVDWNMTVIAKIDDLRIPPYSMRTTATGQDLRFSHGNYVAISLCGWQDPDVDGRLADFRCQYERY